MTRTYITLKDPGDVRTESRFVAFSIPPLPALNGPRPPTTMEVLERESSLRRDGRVVSENQHGSLVDTLSAASRAEEYPEIDPATMQPTGRMTSGLRLQIELTSKVCHMRAKRDAAETAADEKANEVAP